MTEIAELGGALTAGDIEKALAKRHPLKSGWVFATSLYTSTGATPSNNGGLGGLRQIDAFAMGIWPSLRYTRIAYEIKVSRSDFLKELDDPTKMSQAYYLSNQFWFAVAPGVVRGESLKGLGLFASCGIMEVQTNGGLKIVLRAPKRNAWPMPVDFMASLLARVARKS